VDRTEALAPRSRLGSGGTTLRRCIVSRGVRGEAESAANCIPSIASNCGKRSAFEFEGLRFENAFVLNLPADSRVVVGIESVERLAPILEQQQHPYLWVTDCGAGVLINLNETLMKHDTKRIVNRSEDHRRPPLPRVLRVK
jgi:hypothetical protein